MHDRFRRHYATRKVHWLFPALKGRAKVIPTLRVEELVQIYLKDKAQVLSSKLKVLSSKYEDPRPMRAIPTLKISISGVRGVIGDSLSPTLLTRFAQAFGTYVGSGSIVIGRDPRTSGEMVKQAVIAGLLSSGCRVIDIGMCPV